MWLSVKRGQMRTCIPLFVSVCGVILLFQLTYTLAVYHAKLEELNNSPDIRGYLTDIEGKQTTGLVIDGNVVDDLVSFGHLSEINVTKELYYSYIDKLVISENQVDTPKFEYPATLYSQENFFYQLVNGPSAIFTSNLSTVPEFYYSSAMQINFDKSYDSTVFAQEVQGFPYCIISTAFMEEKGIQFGDIIEVVLSDGYKSIIQKSMRVIGSYVKAGKLDNIYCQLGDYISPGLLIRGGAKDLLREYTFDSLNFRLTSGEVLPNLKNYLFNKGYSEVNKIRQIRSFIIIEDKEYLNTKSALSQRILYIDRIFPALYILTEVIAALIPFLLTLLRKREIAIMRGQGTSKLTVFFNIFLEQAVLIVVGSVIGILVSLFLFMRYNTFGFVLTGIFAVCWLVGTIISVYQINRYSVQSILKAEE
jgi:hypothetical protein